MRRAHDLVGDPPLRRHDAGFPGLVRVIVGQQLSIASAAAIWARVVRELAPLDAARLANASDEQLRAAGLSRPKMRTLRNLAAAVSEGALDLAALDQASDEEVHAALTAISGIGPWTADIYLLFCLGRADAWANGDLALQIAAQEILELEQRPGPRELAAIAERWRPWRGVAATLLWSYYGHLRTRRPFDPLATRD
jgi:DNA-3-methyladenine glycosylase II